MPVTLPAGLALIVCATIGTLPDWIRAMRYPTRKTLSHFGLAFLMAAASACAGDSANKAKSPRALWLDNPSSGSQNGDVIKIPGLSVSFEKPTTLYVFKDCQESAHSRN